MGRGRTTATLTNRVSSLLQVRSDEEYGLHFANVLSRWAPEFTKRSVPSKVLFFSHIRKLNEQYLQKNDRFYLSHRPIAIHRKLACIWMAIGYDKC